MLASVFSTFSFLVPSPLGERDSVRGENYQKTTTRRTCAPVAQWIEHLPPEQGATGSNPVRRTIVLPLLCKEGLGEVESPIFADKKFKFFSSFKKMFAFADVQKAHPARPEAVKTLRRTCRTLKSKNNENEAGVFFQLPLS
jgi:hypothetical protein